MGCQETPNEVREEETPPRRHERGKAREPSQMNIHKQTQKYLVNNAFVGYFLFPINLLHLNIENEGSLFARYQ